MTKDLAALFADMTMQSILRHLIELPGVESVHITLSSGKKLEETKKPSDKGESSVSEAG